MKEKKYNILMLIVILVLDVIYMREILNAPSSKMTIISPYYFPKIISILLFLFLFAQLIITLLDKNDGAVTVNSFLIIIGTIIDTVLLLFLWNKFGLFYIFVFIYLETLLLMYRDTDRFKLKTLVFNTCFSVGLELVIYILFAVLLKIKL